MSVLHRQSSGSQIPATFDALEEECFRQLDSRYTTDIYPAMLQLLSSSLYLLLVLCILCFWHSCHQFHHPPSHTSLPPCEGLVGKLLLTTHLSQIRCRLAVLLQGLAISPKPPPSFISFLKEVPKANEIACFEELTQHNKTCPQPENT